MAFIWIVILELFSSILEYIYLDVGKAYVFHMEESIFKELLISAIFVSFVWYLVSSIIFMYRKQFVILSLYGSVCIYLAITHDLTFNLLLHNLNPFELGIDGFGFYMIFQVLLKIVIIYLLIKMFLAIKTKKQS
ncbi:hypothetical protein LPB137_02855 [Poseidonibacter parvus]|uniref:Uncharacterized protein n=1 Tax=Poseidonibacter parvus TaxID=1850254 RepID=A0A1P8KJX8_9BACT|nr:hypothetical protein [Poseidonibacter parvus]APW64859.1 hypothetical protein LPB137_02855 [Poseidonibacter parvus]